MDSPRPPIIELRHISHEYGSAALERDLVLSDINLSVQENDAVALLGPSGCGKSTLLRIMAGLITPTKGEVFFQNLLLRGVAPGVAMVFQNFALFPWLTVRGNVLLPVGTLPEAEQQSRLETVLNTVGLGAYEYAYPRELSGGMKQRVGIARSLIAEPIVLAMDEPFSALDVLTAETLRGEIGRLLADPNHPLRTMVFVTHNITEAVFLATRIVVMAAQPGRVDVVVPNPLPYPRDPDAPEFKQIVAKLHGILTHTILPETPAADEGRVVTKIDELRRRIAPVSLPYVTPAEVLGSSPCSANTPTTSSNWRSGSARNSAMSCASSKPPNCPAFVQTPEQDVILTPLGRQRWSKRLHRRPEAAGPGAVAQAEDLRIARAPHPRARESDDYGGGTRPRIASGAPPREAPAAPSHALVRGTLCGNHQIRPAPTPRPPLRRPSPHCPDPGCGQISPARRRYPRRDTAGAGKQGSGPTKLGFAAVVTSASRFAPRD